MRTRLRQRPPALAAAADAPLLASTADVADETTVSSGGRVAPIEAVDDPPLLLALMEAPRRDEGAVADGVDEDEDELPLFAMPEPGFDDADAFDGDDSFVLGSPPDMAPAPARIVAEDPSKVVVAFTSNDPPFDPPDGSLDDTEDDAPFDPPDAAELEQSLRRPGEAPEETNDALVLGAECEPAETNAGREVWRSVAPLVGKPVPPIVIHAAWDRPETAALLEAFATDPRMARAECSIHRGGVDGAVVAAGTGEAPDLVIVDSTLSGAELVSGLDRLRWAAPAAQVIVIGAANDIGLLRELTARGVTQYIVAPTRAEHLLRVVCTLYADFDRSRTIAVIGARGGVGTSAIAHNIAWSIAERQYARTALVDLDLAFGAVGYRGEGNDQRSLTEILRAPEDDDAFDRAALTRGERLHIVPAPAAFGAAAEFGIAAVERVMRSARRASPYVVLDLPHLWTGWVSHVLERADEVVIVATPELASLRNTENLLRAIEGARPERNAPIVILSQTGMPKRPEISLKEFAGSVRSPPVAAIPFDPALFGAAAVGDCALAMIEPNAKAVKAIESLAWALTGRDPITVRAKIARRDLAPIVIEPAPVLPANENTASPLADGGEVVREGEQRIEGASAPSESHAPTSDVDIAAQAPLLYADYVAKARQAMEAELAQLQTPHKRSRFGARMMTLAALVFSIGLVGGAWRMRDAGSAMAQPQQAAAAPAPAQAPDPVHAYERAVHLLESGEYGPAVAHLTMAAEAGHAQAQHRLALMYESGNGVNADIALARRWTERAAAKGEPRAMHDLGVYYARGEGGAQDDAAAFRWFRQAAEFGIADSQYNLGVLYERGRGVEPDAHEALFWFMLAAAQGDPQALERVRRAEIVMSPFELEQARVRSQTFQARFTPIGAAADPSAASLATEAPPLEPARAEGE